MLNARPSRRFRFVGVSAGIVLLAGAIGFLAYYYYAEYRSPGPAIVSLQIASEDSRVAVNERRQLRLIVRYSDGTEKETADKVEWKSSDGSIVKVDSSGFVEGVDLGSAQIVASYEKQTSKPLLLTVVRPLAAGPRVVDLKLQADKTEIRVGERVYLTAVATYSDGKAEDVREGVIWESSDPFVAWINREGEIEGRKQGDAQVLAKLGGLVARPVTITVATAGPVANRPSALTLDAEKKEIFVNERIALAVNGKYADGTVKKITEGINWKSNNEAAAAVTTKGEVEGRSPGKAEIIAGYYDLVTPPLTVTVKRRTTGVKEPEVNVIVIPPPGKASVSANASGGSHSTIGRRADRPKSSVKPSSEPLASSSAAPGTRTPFSPSTRTPQVPTPVVEQQIAMAQYEVTRTTAVFREPRPDSSIIATLSPMIRVNVVALAGDYVKVVSKRGRPPGYVARRDVRPVTRESGTEAIQ